VKKDVMNTSKLNRNRTFRRRSLLVLVA